MTATVETRERPTPSPTRHGPAGRLARRIDYLSDRKFGLLLFLPAGLLVALVAIPPIGAVFGMSLFRIELLRDGPSHYVALKNFHRMLADSNFTASIPRTVLFAVATTALTVPLALATAMLMHKAKPRYAPVLSVTLLMPWAIAPIVTGFFWRFMFEPSFGVVTSILRGIGVVHGPAAWLEDPGKAFTIAVVATAWRSAPLLALIILGALKSIPKSLYAAAAMDGAAGFHVFRAVTLPAIRATLFISTILQIIISLQVFDLLFQLTRGGPGLETTTVAYYIYDAAFNNLSLGYSAMLALFLMAVIIVFSLLAAYLGRSRKARVEVTDDELVEMRLRTAADATAEAPSASTPAPVAARARPRRRLPRPARKIAVGVGVALLLIWSVGPTLWILVASVQPESAVTSSPPLPTWHLDFTHYRELFTSHEWISSFKVSGIVTAATTVITLVLAAMAAYPLARLRIRGKNVVIALLMFTYTVPALVLAIPLLLVYNHVGLTDTIEGLVIANVAFSLPLAIWLLKAIFENVPESLEKSARIDGCSRIGTLFRVTVPAARSGIAATALLLMISVWNEFLFAVVLGSHGAVTITRRIGYINSPTGIGGEPPYTYQAAAGIVAVLPVILLVIFFHRRISSGLADSYLKG